MNIFKRVKRFFANLFIQKEGEDEQELQNETQSESTEWRTRRYRRFYEGYTEVMVPKEGGGYRTDMVYTDPYYRADVSEQGWRMLKLFYWLLMLLSAAIWGVMALTESGANRTLYVYIPEVVTLLAFLMMLRYLIERSFAPHKLIIREYRVAVKNVRLMCLILMGAQLLTAAMVLLHVVISLFTGSFDPQDLLQIAGLLCSALCIFVIYRKDKSISYQTLPNEKAHIKGHKVRS